MSFIAGPIGGSTTSKVQVNVKKLANQNFTANTENVIVWDSVVTDTHSGFNTSTGLFTVPAGHGGRYLLTYKMLLDSVAVVQGTSIFISDSWKNGYYANAALLHYQVAPTTGTYAISCTGAVSLELAAGDTIGIVFYPTINCSIWQNIGGDTFTISEL